MPPLGSAGEEAAAALFAPGAVVVVSLAGPREKFWGALRAITPAGISLTGIDLNSFDDFVRALRAGEPAVAGTAFFPMHRVERVDADLGISGLPSLRERFETATGQSLEAAFGAARPGGRGRE